MFHAVLSKGNYILLGNVSELVHRISTGFLSYLRQLTHIAADGKRLRTAGIHKDGPNVFHTAL